MNHKIEKTDDGKSLVFKGKSRLGFRDNNKHFEESVFPSYTTQLFESPSRPQSPHPTHARMMIMRQVREVVSNTTQPFSYPIHKQSQSSASFYGEQRKSPAQK